MATKTNGTGVLNGIAGTFTYTPPGGGSAAVINGIITKASISGSYGKKSEIMSQNAGIKVGERLDDRRIEGSVSGVYLSSGTTVYLKRGGILVLSSMSNSDHDRTYFLPKDAHSYGSGEDIGFDADLEWCEGFTATAEG